jgi:hypothetical protein
MFLSCSHFNVSPFARNVSTLAAIFAPNVSWEKAMFLRRCDYVFAPLQIPRPHTANFSLVSLDKLVSHTLIFFVIKVWR